MTSLNQARRMLWRSQAILGDVNAVRRGPTAVAKRVVRKHAHRAVSRLLRQVLR